MRALAVVFLAACCPWNEGSEYVPITVAVYHDAPQVEIAPPAPPGVCDRGAPDIATCTPIATVRVRGLGLDPRCYYDNKVTNGEVGRVMQCASGTMVVFEHAAFVGGAGAYVDACTATTYDFPQGDRCTWRTEQRIEGSLSSGLTYSYVESPVAGHDCTLACRATASLEVMP